jgi:hypothetical protein
VRRVWGEQVTTKLAPALAAVHAQAAGETRTSMAKAVAAATRHQPEPLSVEDVVAALTAPDPAEFMRRAEQRFDVIGEGLWDNVRQSLADGLDAGDDMAALQQRVQDAAGVSEPWARVVARTEVSAACNGASIAQARMLDDASVVKEWLATPGPEHGCDVDTRKTHCDADGQRVRIGQPFQVGGAELDHPGDPTGPPDQVFSCRCSMVFDLGDEPNLAVITAATPARRSVTMQVEAVRADGALLISQGGDTAAIYTGDGLTFTTVELARARGQWSTPAAWLPVPDDVAALLEQQRTFLFGRGNRKYKRDKNGKFAEVDELGGGSDGKGSDGGSGAGAQQSQAPSHKLTGALSDAEFEERQSWVTDVIGKAMKTESTDKKYSKDGVWDPQRDKLHRDIAADLYSRADGVPNDGKAVIAGGLGGAGKSTVLRGFAGVDSSQYLTLNPDDVKEAMAERGLVPDVPGAPDLTPMERSALIHEESSRIAQLVASMAYADRKNVIWDVTMSSEGSTRSRIDALKRNGYSDVKGVFVDIPVEVSVDRALSRYRRGLDKYGQGEGEGGRFVPPSIIRAQETSSGRTVNRDVFDSLRNEFGTWSMYDNAGSHPKLIDESARVPPPGVEHVLARQQRIEELRGRRKRTNTEEEELRRLLDERDSGRGMSALVAAAGEQPVQDLLDRLAAGDLTVKDVAADFAARTWPALPAPSEAAAWGVTDDPPADPDSWATVNADPRLSPADYQTLAKAYAKAPKAKPPRDKGLVAVHDSGQPMTAADVPAATPTAVPDVQVPAPAAPDPGAEGDDNTPAEHTGAMVALVPSDADLARLAVDGGELPAELHCTLLYLGEAADIPDPAKQAIIDRLTSVLDGWPQVDCEGFALALFNPDGVENANDREPCAVLQLSGEDLDHIHGIVEETLVDVVDEFDETDPADPTTVTWEPPEQHCPWIPHITLQYQPDPAALAALLGRVGPVLFDKVRIAFAGETTDIQLAPESELPGDVGEPDDGMPVAPQTAAGTPPWTRQFVGRMPDTLQRYWLRKLAPFGPGTFRRCVRGIRKYFPRSPEGTCADLIKTGSGHWPGEHHSANGGIALASEETSMTAPASAPAPSNPAAPQDCPPGAHWDPDANACVDDTTGEPVDGTIVVLPAGAPAAAAPAAVPVALPTGSPAASGYAAGAPVALPTGSPAASGYAAGPAAPAPGAPAAPPAPVQGDCPDGQHVDPDTGDCVPDEPADSGPPAAMDTGQPEHFHALAHVEGVSTGMRMFKVGALTWRTPPFAFHWQRNSSAHSGTPETVQVGNVTRVARQGEQDAEIHTWGRLDLGSPEGLEYARKLVEGWSAWVSIGLDESPADVEYIWPDGSENGDDIATLFAEPEQMVFSSGRIGELTAVSVPAQAEAIIEPTAALIEALAAMGALPVTAAAVAAHKTATDDGAWDGAAAEAALPSPLPLTTARDEYAWVDDSQADSDGNIPKSACKFPHHDVNADGTPGAANLSACSAVIAALHGGRGGADIPDADRKGVYDHVAKHLTDGGQEPAPFESLPLVAAGHVIELPDRPPAHWFDRPTDVTPRGALTVTDEGRLYGYLAPAGVAHRAFPSRRVEAPMGRVDYSRWMGRETIVAGGGRVVTGVITMGCGHCPPNASSDPAERMKHYDNTCSVAATARIGEDQHGVWIAGALHPGVTGEQVARIMACVLSGDWAPHPERPGWQEFVAALLVPVPGFPMARSGPSVRLEQGALVAAAVPVRFAEHAGDTSLRPALERIASSIGRDARSRMVELRRQVYAHAGKEVT